MTEPHGVWVYAVARQATAPRLGSIAGVGGGPVRIIATAGLSAIAGDVRLAEFGESALRRNLEDLAWLEETARAHHQVIEAVARQCPVVPMQLATVCSTDASVTALLTGRSADLGAALDRVTAREEWGVKAYAVQPAEGRAAPPTTRPGHAAGGQGAAYLRRRRTELTARQDARREATASADAVHAELRRQAVESRLHPAQSPQLTATRDDMILNAAYLLEKSRSDGFAAAVEDMAGRYQAIRLELTGPWPPYSFAGPAELAGRA
jgi:hypothetical protein